MQFQSDLLGIPVEVAAIQETTALGAAFLAGLAVGVWKGPDELRERRAIAARYEPKMSRDEREQLYEGWKRAVERSRGWASSTPA
jgi:glycerol kinase